MFKQLRFCCIVPIFAVAAMAQTTTLGQEADNNTAACSAVETPSYCEARFTAMSDSSGVYNSTPGNVSTEDTHELLYSGATTRLFTHFQPWFCMGSSSSTGTGSVCASHIQVGYNSADASTVHGQINDMIQRGFNGTIVDYYGPLNTMLDTSTALLSNDVAARCSGSQNCPFYFALTYDQGAFEWTRCPLNGGGTDQTQCIIDAMSADFDYMNSHYFGTLGYMRVDNSTMQITASGSPVVLFFVCESCFINPTPNWTTIWSALRQHTATYGTNAPNLFIYRNAGGFTHTQTDGGYAWVNWYGSSDPYGLVYLDKFYDSAKSATQNNPALITVGAQWKGFDNTNAPWVTTPTVTGQQCGQTWLQTFKQITYNNDFGSGHQLPFSGVVTWNDYEEGTEIETGIDNCLSLSAAMSSNSSLLNWTLNFSNPAGSENTVHHYLVFDSPDGTNLTQIANVPAGSHSLDLGQFGLSTGSHTLYVKAVGQPSILNKMSNGVPFSVAAAPSVQSLVLNPSSLTGGTNSTGTVTLTIPAGSSGVVVTLFSNSAAASVPTQVTVPAGATSANFTITTLPVSSPTTASISAATGSSTVSTNLTISPAVLSQVVLSPSSVGGSTKTTLTIQLSGPAPGSGATVTISSSSSAVPVHSTITVPGGASSVSTVITTQTVTTTTQATITATYAGVSRSSAITIYVTPSKLSLSPSTVNGGSNVNATVTLTGPAPAGGEVVQLQSNSSYTSVPASVTVAAGALSVQFKIATQRPSTNQSVTITASAWGVSKSATLTVKR